MTDRLDDLLFSIGEEQNDRVDFDQMYADLLQKQKEEEKKRSIRRSRFVRYGAMAACAVALVLWGESKIIASTVAIIWGFAFALIPVGWSTWITRSLSDQAEKAGSIQVAVIQLANTCGAAVGGIALDHLGLLSPLVLSGILMLFTGLLVAAKVKVNSPA